MTTNEAQVLFNNAIVNYAKFNSLSMKKQEIMNFIENEIDEYRNKQSLTPSLISHIERLVEFYTACKILIKEKEKEQQELKDSLQKIINNFQQIKES